MAQSARIAPTRPVSEEVKGCESTDDRLSRLSRASLRINVTLNVVVQQHRFERKRGKDWVEAGLKPALWLWNEIPAPYCYPLFQ